MASFADMPGEFRMAARAIVENAGGMVAGYYDGALQVALPADIEACRRLTAELGSLGLSGADQIVWFPLGSDNPPESLRHFGIGTAACPRGERPGYWKYRNFHVAERLEYARREDYSGAFDGFHVTSDADPGL